MNIKRILGLLLWLMAVNVMLSMASSSENPNAQASDYDVLYDVSFIGHLNADFETNKNPVINREIISGGHPGTLALSKTRIIFEYKIVVKSLAGPILIFGKGNAHRYHAKFFRQGTVLGITTEDGEAYYFYNKAGFSKKDYDLIFDVCPDRTDIKQKPPS
jgi:hypothetical protein